MTIGATVVVDCGPTYSGSDLRCWARNYTSLVLGIQSLGYFEGRH